MPSPRRAPTPMPHLLSSRHHQWASQRSSEPWVAQILGGGEGRSIATVGSTAGNKLVRQPRSRPTAKGVQFQHGGLAARRSPWWAQRRGDLALGLWLDDMLDLVGGFGRPVGTVGFTSRWPPGGGGRGRCGCVVARHC
ncbi:hypothetical protein TIFTF001_030036 [Ficus carica]|uniref:Uncharacterized protein n=1 Tax=Ficus carica TaxID=3494 RepID=A0AA88J4C2_FICCA|nr:hypothetical protein TIFTF001_030036 [Ficus carica]